MAGPSTWGVQVLGFGAGKAPAVAATTTMVQVRLAVFDENDDCACTATGATQIWEDSADEAGSGLSPSVNDWISGMGGYCAQVTALNVTGSVDDYTSSSHSDCSDCNDVTSQCTGGGGGEDPPPKCLLPDMLVKRLNGSLAKVADLSLGDIIWTPSGTTQVIKLMKDHPSSPREGYYIIEDELCLTNDHPILVDGKMVRAEDYPGDKQYVEELTSTVYVGTVAPTFNVYCGDNVYVVDGQVK